MKLPSPIRQGSAVVGIAGALLLAGCAAESSSADTATGSAPSPSTEATASSATSSPSAVAGEYKDGTFTADGSYQTPETVEKISVSITLSGGTVTKVSVTGDPQAAETTHYQTQFIGGISAQVVGKKLDEISVDRVAGSSLTSKGFNQALATIRTEAAG